MLYHNEWCKIRKGVHDVIDDAAMASNAVMLAEKIFLREAAADGPLPREKLLSKCFMKIEFSSPFSKSDAANDNLDYWKAEKGSST